jgi:SAM-dependent methyltransferase
MQLNYWQDSWALDRERCPCDFHFLEYLTKRGADSKSIFHFGSGEHHLLGRANLVAPKRNEILAITASKSEHAAYVDLIIRNPEIAKYYKVLFADIYTLSAALLPDFDFVTLFHLCEFYDSAKSAYAHHNDDSLLQLFLSKLKPGGRILFYRRSSAFAEARSIIQGCLSSGRLVEEKGYKSLLICKAGPVAPLAGSNLARPAIKPDSEVL